MITVVVMAQETVYVDCTVVGSFKVLVLVVYYGSFVASGDDVKPHKQLFI
jgi:hypothetical protein